MLALFWLVVAVNVIHFTDAIKRDIRVVKDEDYRRPFYLTNIDDNTNGAQLVNILYKTFSKNVLLIKVYRNKESQDNSIIATKDYSTPSWEIFGNLKQLLITTKTQVPVYKNKEYMGYVEFLGGITNGFEIFRVVHHHLRRKTISSIRLKSADGMLIGSVNTFPVTVEDSMTLWAEVKEEVQVRIPFVKDSIENDIVELFQEKPDGAHILERLREMFPKNVVIVSVRKNKEKGTDNIITYNTEPMETSGVFNIKKLKKLYVTTKSQVQVYVNDGYAGVMEIPGRMEHSSVLNVKRAVENHLMIKLNRTEIDIVDSKVKVRISNDTVWKNVEVIRTPANDHQLQSQQLGEQNKLLALKTNQNNGEHVWESVMKLYGSDIAEIQDENGMTILPRQDDPQFSCPLGSSCPFMPEIPTQVNIANLKTLYVVSGGTVVEKIHTDIIGNQCDEIFLGEYAFESNIWSKVIAKWKWVEEFGKITTGNNVPIEKDGNKLLKTAGLTLILKQKITYIAKDTKLYYN